MKAPDILKPGWILLSAFLLFCNIGNSQNKFAGSWEGIFMKEFRIDIHFTDVNTLPYTGKLLMYSGENLIQNDELSEININGNRLTFNIPAKSTKFNGELNETGTELQGVFIFPDGSEHSLFVSKGKNNEPEVINSHENFIVSSNKKYTSEALKSDLTFLMDKLKEYHPQLYAYTSENSFNTLMNQINTKLNDPSTLEDYFELIAMLIEQVKCSHTGARLPKNYLRDVHKYGNFFPLKLSLIKNKAYYVSNYGNFEPSIALGSEIVSINNVPTEDILSELLVFIPSEGTNSTTKRNELNHNFNAYYYLLDSSKIFEVEFKISETENKIIAVPACSFNEFIAPSQSKASNLPITFTIDTINDIGLLKIKSFEIPDINGYIKKMDSVFQLLENKNIENLVIDLRDNKGGHPIFAAQLFSYFAATEFTYFKQNPKVPDFEPLYNPMQPSKYNFKGKTYVFINGACLSTTGHLISLIQYHTKAIFIGEEPGSSFYCNDQSTQIVLPNTRIEVTIPRTTFETATTGYTKGKPFNVDYKVNSSLSDILNGKDTYMEFLNELIEK